MSLRRRLFLSLFLVFVVGFIGVARWIQGELRDSYALVVEEILVDASQLFAAQIENEKMSPAGFQSLRQMFETARSHPMRAKIFEVIKDRSAFEMYVTDEKGFVIYASDASLIGKDYSNWNDVKRTLRGEYGARSTRLDKDDNRSSVYFVASPIFDGERIIGVLSVYKTEGSILVFLDRALERLLVGGIFSFAILGLFAVLLMLWITRPLEKLRLYALAVSEGGRIPLPPTGIKEIHQLGQAFEKMRVSLEGKKTVERYTQTLTHELKSPLTAIKGAAELCLEEMNPEQRSRFLNNIIGEAHRSHQLLEQLLKIAALESRARLEEKVAVDPVGLAQETREALDSLWRAKNLGIDIVAQSNRQILGDRFLLFQALRNIVQNAIEFSLPEGKIVISVSDVADRIVIEVRDEGVGIPDFAKERIFEKFYSLERPGTERKSSGLGLSFVKEVIEQHGGHIEVSGPAEPPVHANSKGPGCSVKLHFVAIANSP